VRVSLGLPSHIAVRIVSSSFVRGLHAVALTCLVAAFAAAAIFQIAREDDIIWPAMIAIIPMATLLWAHRRTRSLFFAISYLWVGAVCTYWYLVTFYSQAPPILASDAFAIAAEDRPGDGGRIGHRVVGAPRLDRGRVRLCRDRGSGGPGRHRPSARLRP